ncbi:MAG: hypothetical protein L0H83_01375 [Salinisphaera sp.]|nr:hypothetical protein [Salinisphaera sp.]
MKSIPGKRQSHDCWTIYDSVGAIVLNVIASADSAALDVPAGGSLLEGWYTGDVYYINDGAPIERPACPHELMGSPAANGTTQAVLSGLPAGTEIRIYGPANDRFEVDDTELVMAFNAPGKYRVLLRPPFPYKPADTTISVAL